MKIVQLKDNINGDVILFSETTVKDYLYNSPLNLISDTRPDDDFIKNKRYSNIGNKFYSYEILCSLKTI